MRFRLVFGVAALVTAGTAQAFSPKIIGGADASIEQYPWQVALLGGNSDLYAQQSCGGSLIHPQWVLTAAHCVPADAPITHVAVGITNLGNPSGSQVIAVTTTRTHVDYNKDTFNNDIALLKLSTPVDMTSCGSRCTIIAVVTSSNEASRVFTGATALISGWGNRQSDPNLTNDFPQQLQATSVSIMNCLGSGSDYAPSSITDNMLCAGVPGLFTRDTCQGDSGGPLVVENGSGGYIQAGVVSFGEGCAKANYPGVYTRLARYTQWIQDNTDGQVMPSASSSATSAASNTNSGGSNATSGASNTNSGASTAASTTASTATASDSGGGGGGGGGGGSLSLWCVLLLPLIRTALPKKRLA